LFWAVIVATTTAGTTLADSWTARSASATSAARRSCSAAARDDRDLASHVWLGLDLVDRVRAKAEAF